MVSMAAASPGQPSVTISSSFSPFSPRRYRSCSKPSQAVWLSPELRRKGQQLTSTVLAHPVGHQHMHPLPAAGPPHAPTHAVQKQVRPFVGQRRLVKLSHRLVQLPRQARNRLRTDRLVGQNGHQPSDLAGRDPAQECLPDQQVHLRRPTLELLQHLGQEPLLAGAGDTQPQRPEAGDEVTFVVAVAVVLPWFLPAMPRTDHVQVALPLRQQLEQPPHALLHLSLQIAPESLLQLTDEMLELLGDGYNLGHGCKSPFENGFCLCGKKPTYTLSLFTQSKLRHPAPNQQLSFQGTPTLRDPEAEVSSNTR